MHYSSRRTLSPHLTIVQWELTAMPLRDELFNRLAAMGSQKWFVP